LAGRTQVDDRLVRASIRGFGLTVFPEAFVKS
jgi:hypothetical protein